MLIKATPAAVLDPPAVFLHYKDAVFGFAGFWTATPVWQEGPRLANKPCQVGS